MSDRGSRSSRITSCFTIKLICMDILVGGRLTNFYTKGYMLVVYSRLSKNLKMRQGSNIKYIKLAHPGPACFGSHLVPFRPFSLSLCGVWSQPHGHPVLSLYRGVGNKPCNSPKGHRPDGHSSVTDLANSLTGDMVMVRQHLL